MKYLSKSLSKDEQSGDEWAVLKRYRCSNAHLVGQVYIYINSIHCSGYLQILYLTEAKVCATLMMKTNLLF